MKTLTRFILLVIITALMAGCKLAVIVVEGGEVQSTASGVRITLNVTAHSGHRDRLAHRCSLVDTFLH